MKAVYVSLLTVITQRGITNREKGARGEGGGRCECVYRGVELMIMGTAAVMARGDTSGLCKYGQTNNTYAQACGWPCST